MNNDGRAPLAILIYPPDAHPAMTVLSSAFTGDNYFQFRQVVDNKFYMFFHTLDLFRVAGRSFDNFLDAVPEPFAGAAVIQYKRPISQRFKLIGNAVENAF